MVTREIIRLFLQNILRWTLLQIACCSLSKGHRFIVPQLLRECAMVLVGGCAIVFLTAYFIKCFYVFASVCLKKLCAGQSSLNSRKVLQVEKETKP